MVGKPTVEETSLILYKATEFCETFSFLSAFVSDHRESQTSGHYSDPCLKVLRLSVFRTFSFWFERWKFSDSFYEFEVYNRLGIIVNFLFFSIQIILKTGATFRLILHSREALEFVISLDEPNHYLFDRFLMRFEVGHESLQRNEWNEKLLSCYNFAYS